MAYSPSNIAQSMYTPMMPSPSGKAQRPKKSPAGSLIKLPDAEQVRILSKITGDYSDAWQDNERRFEDARRHFRSWRNKIGMAGGVSGRSNFRVPLIVEKVLVKWAKMLDALLGDDAEVIGQPTGPVDRMVAEKVSRYMTWQVFNHMDIVEELAKFLFQEIIFGRAHAELFYDVRWLYGPGEKRQLLYDGPTFKTLPFDCFVVPPAAGENTPQDFSWVCTREWKTLDQLLIDEEEGYCENIADNAEAIYRHADTYRSTDSTQDRIRQEQAGFEGVISDYAVTDRCKVEVRKHYYRWRPLKGRSDAEYDDFKARTVREAEWVTTYIPDLNIGDGVAGGLHIGTRDLAELYPLTANRRPIVTASMLKDGSYWSPGLPELLEDIEIEKSVNHNLMNEAGERAVSPPGFYIPGMGIGEEKQKIEPGMLYPTPNPQSVYFADTKADYNFCVIRDQMLTVLAEGVSGLTAASVGRSAETPNTPRTFRGQALLQGQSDIRQNLEMIFTTEDWSKILDQIKMLVDTYGPEEEEFRVTEQPGSGYFDSRGFAKITAQERQGKYDFKLKFATSSQSREARKERTLAFLQAAAPLPIFAQNPNLQRDWLKVMAKELQLDGLLPALTAVPDSNVPVDPETEWVMALQGIAPQIHPMDDDQQHIDSHMGHLTEQQGLAPEQQDEDAQQKMIAHVMQHKEQQRQKLALQAQAQAQAAAQAVTGMLTAASDGQPQQQGGQLQGNPLAALMGGGGGAPPQMGAADAMGGFQGDIGAEMMMGGQ